MHALVVVDVPADDTPPPVITPPDPSTGIIVLDPYSEPAIAPWWEGSPMSGPTFSMEYIRGAELPAMRIPWAEETGIAIDFTTGWTFSLLIGHIGKTADVAKVAGITGGLGHIDVAWSTDFATDLNALALGTYDAQLSARRTSDTADRIRMGELIILPGILS